MRRERGWISRVAGYAMRRPGEVLIALGAVLVSSATMLAGPLVARQIIDHAPGRSGQVPWLVAGFVAIGLVRAAAGYVRRYRSNTLGIRVQHDLRNDIFTAVQRLDGPGRDRLQGGQVLSRATTDLAAVQGLLYLVPVLLGHGLVFLGAFAVMLLLSPTLTVISLCTGAALGLLAWRSRRTVVPATWAAQQQAARVVGVAAENIAGAQVIRGFGREDDELTRFEGSARTLFAYRVRAARYVSKYTAALLSVPALGQIALLALGGWFALRGELTLGTFLAFCAYLTEVSTPLRSLGGALAMIQQSRAALVRLFEITDSEPQVRQRPDAVVLDRARGLLEFEDVTFGFTPGDPVLRGVTLRVEPGEVVAFVGPPGSGKSSLVALLARFYDVDRGAIRVDGHDVRDLDLASLRAQFGFAFEDPFLFHDTVRANIAAGRPDAGEAEVLAAARATEADEFVRASSNGYDTAVGERGEGLSGGQRQRIALARTVLPDPPILVLDDATNAVDPSVEARLLARLRPLSSERTLLLMAHRPATLRLADRIVVLGEDGRVIDVGAHHELANRCPRYRLLIGLAEDRAPARPEPVPAHIAPTVPLEPVEPASDGLRPARDEPRMDVAAATAPERNPSLRRLIRPLHRPFALALVLLTGDVLAGIALPALVNFGIDHGVVADAPAVLAGTAASALLIVLAGAAVNAAGALAIARAAERLLFTLRLKVFVHLHRVRLDVHVRERGGRTLTRLTSDVDALSSFLQTGLVNLTTSALLFVGVLCAMLLRNPPLAAIAFGAVPVLLIIGAVFQRYSAAAYTSMRAHAGEVNADLEENLHGLHLTQVLGRQRQVTEHFQRLNADHRRARLRAYWLTSSLFTFVEAVCQLSTAAVLGVGAALVAEGSLTTGELIGFFLYLALFFAPVQQLSQAFESQQQAAVAWRRIAELLRVPAETASAPVRRSVVPPLRSELELRDVRFRYPGTGDEVLRGVDLRLRAGETVALVGESGAGKSTLVKLIARFHEPTSGTIRADGTDIREFDPRAFRRRLGIVAQEPFLFNTTVRDNVRYGRPDATDEDVERAVRAVGAHLVLDRLSAGLHTPAGPRGASLSAGERQLVALARAQLIGPDLLLLDEATTFLDPASEAAYLEAFDRLTRTRFALVIAHRLSTAERADRVIVLDGGRVAESGAHADLLATGGIYARLWNAADTHHGEERSR